MPGVRRGHVAPKTTLIETIIRKFDTHSEFFSFFYILTNVSFCVCSKRDYEA